IAATIDASVLPSMPKLSRRAASAMFFTSSDPILAEQHIRYFGR
ncbi:hypothetical protein PanWU01x14_257660, partial [Parasponia andersonii]